MCKKTRWAVRLWITSAVTIVTLAGCGLSLDRIIQVPVPDGIADELGLPEQKVALRDVPRVAEQYKIKSRQNLEVLSENEQDAIALFNLLSVGISFGVQQGSGPLSALPGGALLVTALTTGAAYMTRRPGDKSPEEYRKGKEDSYAKGAQDTEQRFRERLVEAGITLGERAAGRVVDKVVDRIVDGGDKK